MSAERLRHPQEAQPHEDPLRAIASAYDLAGDKYLTYADGDPRQIFAFDGQYAFGDRNIWRLLDEKLCALRASGATSIRILDMGCGPGTWLRRIVTRARMLGFVHITARGFDIAGGQVQRARKLSAKLAGLNGVNLTFETGDILKPLAEADRSVDMCLCLCGVFNHLPAEDLAPVFAEIARVTSGCFITTVRAVGSTPTVYIDAIERARRFRQNHKTNRLFVEFQNGQRVTLQSHLFSAYELRSLAAPYLDIEDIRGLDLFHGRFADDPRWNPAEAASSDQFARELDRLEAQYCRDAQFIDHAAHLLFVGTPRPASIPAAQTDEKAA